MATVHLLSLPFSPHFSTRQSLPLTHKTHLPITSTATLSPLLASLSLAASRKRNSFLLLASASPTETELETKLEDEIEEEEEEDEGSRTRIIAQNIPWSSTAEDISILFAKFGTVVNVELSMYNKTRNRGLAFITMGSNEEASAALSSPESFEFEGRTLSLAWAKPRKKQPVTTPKPAPIHYLYVANLPFQARAKHLREFFKSDNANAVSADIIFRENPKTSAGYGFVSFYTKEEAEAALSAFQGKEFMGRSIRVALSKRFLRQGTKASIEAETESTETSSAAETSETTV